MRRFNIGNIFDLNDEKEIQNIGERVCARRFSLSLFLCGPPPLVPSARRSFVESKNVATFARPNAHAPRVNVTRYIYKFANEEARHETFVRSFISSLARSLDSNFDGSLCVRLLRENVDYARVTRDVSFQEILLYL